MKCIDPESDKSKKMPEKKPEDEEEIRIRNSYIPDEDRDMIREKNDPHANSQYENDNSFYDSY